MKEKSTSDQRPVSVPELSGEHIRVHADDGVATVVIDRPAKLNAVTKEMTQNLGGAVEWINRANEVRAVVLTGAGERAFCAGSDIAELDQYPTPWEFGNRADYCDALRHLRKPVIAAVNGYALGGGLEMALSCDIRLASTNATFAAPEVKLGWIGGGGMSVHLSHTIGPGNAAMMLMTGEPIDAARALTWGLVSEVLPPEQLLPRAQELAAVIAERPPIAVETAKANLRAARNLPAGQAIEYERALQTICFATEDAHEGRAAFFERRVARFHRR